MNAQRWEQAHTMFHAALALSDQEQKSFLEKSCGQDAEILGEVQQMLEEDRRADSILDRGLPDVAYRMIGLPAALLSSRVVGAYRLIERIGEGGMGIVWRAERADTGKQVAMKFLPGASLSPARRALFTQEMRTHANLAHGCIAAQYDAGTLPDGTPWFTMEYVEGKHLIEYCRDTQLGLEPRLKLFRSVCAALEYLHLKGIVHRDLKPSNIVVDGSGTPKILDFGIARELHSSGEVKHPDLQIMTRAYAAPEWIEKGIVDNSTDVYALGIIFHEMLAGQRPESGSSQITLKRAGHLSGVSKTSWRELDKICRKALNADPAGRYQSVEALRRDVDHFLNVEPLEGMQASSRYRLERFVTKNQRAVGAASFVLLLLAGMAVFFTIRLAEQRDLALAEAKRTKLVEQFLFSLFQGGDRAAGPTLNLSALTLLDRGEQEARALKREPRLKAEFNQVLGGIYQQLGQFDKADELLGASLKERFAEGNSPDIADGLLALGSLRQDQARLPQAASIIGKALAMRRAQSPVDVQAVAKAESALGHVMIDLGRYQDAIQLLEQARQVQMNTAADQSDLAATLIGLSDAHFYLSRYPDADAWAQQALLLHQQLHGRNHPLVAQDLRELGMIQIQTTDFREAEKDFREALGIQQKWYGDNHPETADTQLDLAQALESQGRLAEVEPLLKAALSNMQQAYGEVHPRVALVLNQLGMLAFQREQWNAGAEYDIRAADIYRRTLGAKNQATLSAQNNLASVYLKLGEYQRAEKIFSQTVAVLVEQNLGETLNAGITHIKLGRALVRQRRYREADIQLREGCAIVSEKAGPSAQWIVAVRPDIAEVQAALARNEKSGPH